MAPCATAPTPPRPLREFWNYFSANKGAIAGLVVVVVMLLIALFAPWLAPHDPTITNSDIALSRRSGRPAARWPIRWAPTRSAATSCRA
jgi:dipeptide transport system permease protein